VDWAAAAVAATHNIRTVRTIRFMLDLTMPDWMKPDWIKFNLYIPERIAIGCKTAAERVLLL
jgi:hypothetical protein